MSTTSDRSFLSYAGTNRLLDEYIKLPETIAAVSMAKHVHFAMPLELQVARVLLPILRSSGCTLSIDPGWRKDWFLSSTSLETIRMVDLFLPNEKEAQLLTGDEEPEQMLRTCTMLGIESTVIKLGARGAATLHNGRFYAVTPPHVQVIDTTGAGDAFDAGLIDAPLAGASVEEQLQRACICGSLSTRARGALLALPHREELSNVAKKDFVSVYGE